MPVVLLPAVLLLALAAPLVQGPSGTSITLFDGRTFAGWERHDADLWRIENGALVGGSLARPVPRNDFLVTAGSYGDFVLRLQFKLVGTEGFVNAGVQFRSQRATEPAHEMIGYQADIGPKYWGALYDETRRNRILAQPAGDLAGLVRDGDWNTYEIRAEGPRIQLWLNGRRTVDYTEPDDAIPRAGRIGLQIHGGGTAEVHYRDLVLTPLGSGPR